MLAAAAGGAATRRVFFLLAFGLFVCMSLYVCFFVIQKNLICIYKVYIYIYFNSSRRKYC